MNTLQLCSPITCISVGKGVTSFLCSSHWRNGACRSIYSSVKFSLVPDNNADFVVLYGMRQESTTACSNRSAFINGRRSPVKANTDIHTLHLLAPSDDRTKQSIVRNAETLNSITGLAQVCLGSCTVTTQNPVHWTGGPLSDVDAGGPPASAGSSYFSARPCLGYLSPGCCQNYRRHAGIPSRCSHGLATLGPVELTANGKTSIRDRESNSCPPESESRTLNLKRRYRLFTANVTLGAASFVIGAADQEDVEMGVSGRCLPPHRISLRQHKQAYMSCTQKKKLPSHAFGKETFRMPQNNLMISEIFKCHTIERHLRTNPPVEHFIVGCSWFFCRRHPVAIITSFPKILEKNRSSESISKARIGIEESLGALKARCEGNGIGTDGDVPLFPALRIAGDKIEWVQSRPPNSSLSIAIGCCLLEKAFSYLTGPLKIQQHRRGFYVIRVQIVNTCQTVIQPIKTKSVLSYDSKRIRLAKSPDHQQWALTHGCRKLCDAISETGIRIRLERASQKQSSDTYKTPYDRVKRCRERKINIKASKSAQPDATDSYLVSTDKQRLQPAGLLISAVQRGQFRSALGWVTPGYHFAALWHTKPADRREGTQARRRGPRARNSVQPYAPFARDGARLRAPLAATYANYNATPNGGPTILYREFKTRMSTYGTSLLLDGDSDYVSPSWIVLRRELRITLPHQKRLWFRLTKIKNLICGLSSSVIKPNATDLIRIVQSYKGSTIRHARRSDEALGVRGGGGTEKCLNAKAVGNRDMPEKTCRPAASSGANSPRVKTRELSRRESSQIHLDLRQVVILLHFCGPCRGKRNFKYRIYVTMEGMRFDVSAGTLVFGLQLRHCVWLPTPTSVGYFPYFVFTEFTPLFVIADCLSVYTLYISAKHSVNIRKLEIFNRVEMELRWNARAGETGIPEKAHQTTAMSSAFPTSSKSSDRSGNQTRFPFGGDESVNVCVGISVVHRPRETFSAARDARVRMLTRKPSERNICMKGRVLVGRRAERGFRVVLFSRHGLCAPDRAKRPATGGRARVGFLCDPSSGVERGCFAPGEGVSRESNARRYATTAACQVSGTVCIAGTPRISPAPIWLDRPAQHTRTHLVLGNKCLYMPIAHRPAWRRDSPRKFTQNLKAACIRLLRKYSSFSASGTQSEHSSQRSEIYLEAGILRNIIVKAVHDKGSTFTINLRKKSLILPVYILTGALSDMRPVKLVMMDGKVVPKRFMTGLMMVSVMAFLEGEFGRLGCLRVGSSCASKVKKRGSDTGDTNTHAYNAKIEMSGGNGRSLRKPADQRHRPARFLLAKIRSEPARDRVGGEQKYGEKYKNKNDEENKKKRKKKRRENGEETERESRRTIEERKRGGEAARKRRRKTRSETDERRTEGTAGKNI
ncbi:hypothetical protein PR048_024015 [Dryococelus australis]|uniref:Uncharacterized protein n=1 Tax=Dryococelus australis TaxID=614101 RepID=A0ABQ9GVP1_9NEOP|nr:hypothetical protein PR048_024015 [Dryococelus australis]